MPSFSIDQTTLVRLVETTVILVVAFALFFGLRERILRFATWAGLPRLAFAPVRLILRYAILLVALALILSLWGFQIGTILALIGSVLGLVAIGFVAVWSVLSNFLCTLLLVIFKPFSVGDELEFPADNVKGRVSDLSLVFTTLDSSSTESVVIPNNTFFQKIFKRRRGLNTTGLGDQLRQHHAEENPAQDPLP